MHKIGFSEEQTVELGDEKWRYSQSEIILEGEDFEWMEEYNIIDPTPEQTLLFPEFSAWVSFLGHQRNGVDLVLFMSHEYTPNIHEHFQNTFKSFITMLKQMKLYPTIVAKRCDFIFERNVNNKELLYIYHYLRLLFFRYDSMYSGIGDAHLAYHHRQLLIACEDCRVKKEVLQGEIDILSSLLGEKAERTAKQIWGPVP